MHIHTIMQTYYCALYEVSILIKIFQDRCLLEKRSKWKSKNRRIWCCRRMERTLCLLLSVAYWRTRRRALKREHSFELKCNGKISLTFSISKHEKQLLSNFKR